MTETKPSQITSGVRKHRTPQISHVIPFFQLCTNSQKSQNFNDPTSNIKTTGRELRATFLRNHPRPAPNGELRRLNISLHNVLSVSQKAPSAKRCIKTHLNAFGEHCVEHNVRKHRAPKGALRPFQIFLVQTLVNEGQKAPSAKRCIKTGRIQVKPFPSRRLVRKHRAPKGALRPREAQLAGLITQSQKAPSAKRRIKTISPTCVSVVLVVRKHRAPKGALRRRTRSPRGYQRPCCQKAPSAKRCIKTRAAGTLRAHGAVVRKHRAPKGALRPIGPTMPR